MSEGYIGLSPSYGYFNKQNIAGTVATTYNLDQDVANANQLIVSLDGIIQEPGYAFSIGRSSTGVMQITFAEALPVTTISGSLGANSGETTISGFTTAQTTQLSVGQGVTGNINVPEDTFIATIGSTSITLTNAVTTTFNSGNLTFGARIFIVYLGNVLQTPTSANANTQPLVEYFSSDGTAQSCSLSRTPPNSSSIAVYLDGVFQRGGSGKAYTLSGGAITFTGATPAGGSDNITVFHLATEDNRVTNTTVDGAVTNAKLNLDYSNVNYRAPTVVSTSANQTTQAIRSASASANYGVNDILVFLNGVALEPTNDYTLTGTTMTLVGGAPPTGSSLVVRYLPLTG